MLGTGKHWQQTIKGITKANIGEELQTLGSNYKYWLTLWGSGETLGINYKHWLNIVVLRRMLGRSYKHWEGATNVGERGKFGGAGKHIIGRNLGIDRALRHCFNAIYISGQGI